MSLLIKISIFTFLLSLVLTYAIITVSKKSGFLRKPKEERWNKNPIPTFGGIAIFLSFIVSMLIFQRPLSDSYLLLLGGSAIFLLGLIDDLVDIKPYTKLLIEIGIACAMITGGIHLIFETSPVIYIPLTILWIVGITNAFNLLDNMDGLSPGIGIIGSFIIVLLSIKLQRYELIIPATILGSSLGAFLIFNFNPAKIFLGDCGSLFLGFVLAFLSIKGTWHQASNLFLMLLTPLLILGIPIFDTFFVSLQRKLHGLPITQGGKDHSSHRLVMLGWSERKTVVFLYATSILLGLTAIVGLDLNNYIKSVVFAITLITVILFGLFLAEAKVYKKGVEEKSGKENGKARTIGTVLYKRRILDILIDSTIIIVAYISAYLIKYDGIISEYNAELIKESLPILLFIKLASLYLSGLYKGIWKYIDFEDSLKVLKGALLGSMSTIIILVGFTRFEGYSRSLFLIDLVVFVFLLSGTRIMLRILRESFYAYSVTGKKILLVGAGEAGKIVLNEIRKNRDMNLYPMGFIDDDETKHGKKLMGVPVLGGSNRISEFVMSQKIEKIIITLPSASFQEKEKIIEKCKEAQVDYKVMKSFEELL